MSADEPFPLRILSIIPTLDRNAGGPIEGLLRFNTASRTMQNVTHEIFTLDAPGSVEIDSSVTAYQLGRPRKSGAWLLRRALDHYHYAPDAVRWLRSNIGKYDVVTVHGLWNYAPFAASRALPGGPVPYFHYSHGMMDPWFAKRYPLKHAFKQLFWWFGDGRTAAGAEAVLFTCEEERILAKGQFLGHRYTEQVIGYGSGAPPPARADDAELARQAIPGLNDAPYLLFLSRIHEKKGCDLLIEGFAKMCDRRPELKLVIAGPDNHGWQAELAALAARLGVAERVLFPGSLFGDAKWAAFRSAEAFILPSHQENFGIVVAEALACETPVLISNRVNIWREIADAGCGLVAPDSVDGVVELLTGWFAKSDEEKRAMGQRGRALFDERFNAAKLAPAAVQMMRDAVAKRRNAA